MEVGFVVLLLAASIYLVPFIHVFLPAAAVVVLWIVLHVYLVLVAISEYQALGLIRMHDEMCLK